MPLTCFNCTLCKTGPISPPAVPWRGVSRMQTASFCAVIKVSSLQRGRKGTRDDIPYLANPGHTCSKVRWAPEGSIRETKDADESSLRTAVPVDGRSLMTLMFIKMTAL